MLDFVVKNFDKIFMLLLCIVAIIFTLTNLISLFRSKEFKDLKFKKNIKRNIVGFTYLLKKSSPIKDKSFLNHIVNNGDDPTKLSKKIRIDDCYLPKNNKVIIKRGKL